jgi:predicted nucleic acid-binding protein
LAPHSLENARERNDETDINPFVQLKSASTPIPDNDLWIAAQAPEQDLMLIRRDRHFERIPQLLRG